jgi:glycosyltransferase involved in cell wall biosynthesis
VTLIRPGRAASRGRIVLLTASHLCNNPRAVKEADALSEAGYEVEVLGWATDSSHHAEDLTILRSRSWTFTPFVNLLQASPTNRLRSLAWRAERRLAFSVAQNLGWHSAAQLGGWRRALLAVARQRDADLFIAHSALTIWVGTRLQREGRRVGVDMEDWFSREHPEPYPSALVAAREAELLRASPHATCTSRAMGLALAHAYGGAPPKVVYNAFNWSERDALDGERKDRTGRRKYSIHWYSQTLGEGRGLEDLLAALPHVTQDVEVHLRGTLGTGTRTWLDGRIPPGWRERVHVHPPVTNAELLSRIAEHDVGFSGEMKVYPTRDLTVTNKMLQYLLAGLAVVASDTHGQSEVAQAAPGAVFMYASGEPPALAARINALLESPGQLMAAKRAALDAARDTFCWERIAPVLVDSVAAALARRPAGEIA